MKQLLKQFIRKTSFYRRLKKRRLEDELVAWEKGGRDGPPPHLVKQQAIRTYAEKYGLKYLVETGTYYGDMVDAMRKDFERIYSIELSDELYAKAKKRFRGDTAIELVHGDSGVVLKSVIDRIDQPALFWLDGHYSGGVTARADKDTPVYKELGHIFNAENLGHVIIIDDARCFGSDPAYPGIDELEGFIKSRRPDAIVAVQNDSIRITPPENIL